MTLELFDKTIFIQPDDLKLIDVDTNDSKKNNKNKKKERKTRKPGEYSVRICFKNESLTKSEQETVRTILSESLGSKNARTYFHDLITISMENADNNDSTVLSKLKKLLKNKKIYHFTIRNVSKNSALFSIIPHLDIPRQYANKEMLENFVYNISVNDIPKSMVKEIKSVNAILG